VQWRNSGDQNTCTIKTLADYGRFELLSQFRSSCMFCVTSEVIFVKILSSPSPVRSKRAEMMHAARDLYVGSDSTSDQSKTGRGRVTTLLVVSG
jgi:hypothetical protein